MWVSNDLTEKSLVLLEICFAGYSKALNSTVLYIKHYMSVAWFAEGPEVHSLQLGKAKQITL